MIIVLGSGHDPVARDLARRWPRAALCSAGDLTRPGWTWPVAPSSGGATWVVEGAIVPDEQVTGVFLRRSTVYAAELTTTHPDDRTYLAAELHAFLVHVLARTAATVVNPIDDGGAFGEAALRPEHWMKVAEEAGVDIAPLCVRSAHQEQPPQPATTLELVGDEAVGAVPGGLAEAAVLVCGHLGLLWAVMSFDNRRRLAGITTTPPPSPEAAARLSRLLTDRSVP